jgi:hypothetical protein
MTDDTTNPGPAMAEMVEEVQGVFPSNAALQDAMGKLRMVGFDHADLSLPTTVATGGAAGVVIAAAAAVGAGSALAANAVGTAAKHDQEETRDEAAASGQLVLAVHASTKEKQVEAERIMRESGATSVGTVKRSDASTGIDSTGWTG